MAPLMFQLRSPATWTINRTLILTVSAPRVWFTVVKEQPDADLLTLAILLVCKFLPVFTECCKTCCRCGNHFPQLRRSWWSRKFQVQRDTGMKRDLQGSWPVGEEEGFP